MDQDIRGKDDSAQGGAANDTTPEGAALIQQLSGDRKDSPRLAIAHDFFVAFGGGERVTAAVARLYPRADVFFAAIDAKQPGWSLFSQLPNRLFDLRAPRGPRAIRTLGAIASFMLTGRKLSQYDLLFFTGSFSVFALLAARPKRSIYYCNTTPRFAFDLFDHYRARYPLFLRPLYSFAVGLFRRLYRRAIDRVDTVVANSNLVAARLREQTGREAKVISPPVMLTGLQWRTEGQYYISLARLTPPKRVDVIVRAFRAMPEHRLVVASGGPMRDELVRASAGAANISFLGWVSDRDLADRIGTCRAAIYVPIDEDFGLSPLEAMAAGKPVIVAASGTLPETVIHGVTGLHVSEPVTAEKIVLAVRELERIGPVNMRAEAERRARQFDVSEFQRAMVQEIDQLLAG